MINWYPGHMAKALREIKEKQKLFDLFIIMLDARIPLSSFNPEIFKIINQKPILFVATKLDKTNQEKSLKLLKSYEKYGKVIPCDLKAKNAYQKLNSAINFYYEKLKEKNLAKNKLTPALKCIVLGIPNVGKSTLINLLAKTRSTKVGNMPGVTKHEQWINCKNYLLLDTPGILMPKIDSDITGAKLAITNAIKIESLNLYEVIVEMYKLISNQAPYVLQKINLLPAFDEENVFIQINQYAIANNIVKQKGEIDLNKAINLLIKFFQNLDNIIYD